MNEDGFEPPGKPSSNVGGYRYDAATSELHVRFNSGGSYVYSGVPPTVVEELRSAESAGSYIQRNIARAFPFKRVNQDEASQ